MKSLGQRGEDLACEFLKNRGFKLERRNFHSRFGEIDIIAKKGEILHFIEVKTSQNYDALERITPAKLEKIQKTIGIYELEFPHEFQAQIDAIIIKNDKIEFLENIGF